MAGKGCPPAPGPERGPKLGALSALGMEARGERERDCSPAGGLRDREDLDLDLDLPRGEELRVLDLDLLVLGADIIHQHVLPHLGARDLLAAGCACRFLRAVANRDPRRRFCVSLASCAPGIASLYRLDALDPLEALSVRLGYEAGGEGRRVVLKDITVRTDHPATLALHDALVDQATALLEAGRHQVGTPTPSLRLRDDSRSPSQCPGLVTVVGVHAKWNRDGRLLHRNEGTTTITIATLKLGDEYAVCNKLPTEATAAAVSRAALRASSWLSDRGLSVDLRLKAAHAFVSRATGEAAVLPTRGLFHKLMRISGQYSEPSWPWLSPEAVRYFRDEPEMVSLAGAVPLLPCALVCSAWHVWETGITVAELVGGGTVMRLLPCESPRERVSQALLKMGARQEVCDFVFQCLEPDYTKRPTPRALLQHPFLQ
eukprot:m51a1_g3416 hypothetical protein (430) ;mRNA; r:577029-578901